MLAFLFAKTTLHLQEAHCSSRTGIWNILFVERYSYKGGWLWRKTKTHEQNLRCFGTPDNWRLDIGMFIVHKHSPINRFCNEVVQEHEAPDYTEHTL